jgi:hypothetical protein
LRIIESSYYSQIILTIFTKVDEVLNAIEVDDFKTRFNFIHKDSEDILLAGQFISKTINRPMYDAFRKQTLVAFPNLRNLIRTIELDYSRPQFHKYLSSKKKQMIFLDKNKEDLGSKFRSLPMRKMLEDNIDIFLDNNFESSENDDIMDKMVNLYYRAYFTDKVLPILVTNKKNE